MAKRSVLMLLPSWGGGTGGIYAMAHNLVKWLSGYQHVKVGCVLGVTWEELSTKDQQEIIQLGIDHFHPDIMIEDADNPLDGNVRFANASDYYTQTGEMGLESCNNMLAFSSTSIPLASYFIKESGTHFKDFKLILFNNDSNEGNVQDYIEIGRSGCTSSVLSVGDERFRHLNTHFVAADLTNEDAKNFIYIPDFSKLMRTKTQAQDLACQKRIFMPMLGVKKSEQELFRKFCCCSVTLTNETFKKSNEPGIQMFYQEDANFSQMPDGCEYFEHQHSPQIICSCKPTSKAELEMQVNAASLVIASGAFTESGYSGLEFILNDQLTYVPDDSEMAGLLKMVAPDKAEVLLLKPLHVAKSKMKQTIEDWDKKIHHGISFKHELLGTVRDIAQKIRLHIMRKSEEAQCIIKSLSSLPLADASTGASSLVAKRNEKIKEFLQSQLLGKGTFSMVFKIDDYFAAKVVRIGAGFNNMDHVLGEIQIMQKISHRNLVRFHEHYGDVEYFAIVMDLARENMDKFIKSGLYPQVDKSNKFDVCRQCFRALAYLWTKWIIHQDIKPSNILFMGTGLHTKLSDFGTARIKSDVTKGTSYQYGDTAPGTPDFQAPEVQCGGRKAQHSADVYSMCLSILNWLLRRHPWKTGPDVSLRKMNKEMPDWLPKAPPEAKEMLTKGLGYDIKLRPSAEEFEHHFDRLVNESGDFTPFKIPHVLEEDGEKGQGIRLGALKLLNDIQVDFEISAVHVSQDLDVCVCPYTNYRCVEWYKETGSLSRDIQFATKPKEFIISGLGILENKLLLTEWKSGRIVVLPPKGGFDRRLLNLKIENPSGLCLIDNNTGLIASTSENKVFKVKFEDDGTPNDPQVFISRPRQKDMFHPHYICANYHRMAVSCRNSYNVHVYGLDGVFVYTFGENGRNDKQFMKPMGVALNEENILFVADFDLHKIIQVSSTGHLLSLFDTKADNLGIQNPRAMHVVGNRLYLTYGQINRRNSVAVFTVGEDATGE